MGVGKTTVGRLLAERLERPFYDTDQRVEEVAGRPVPSFFPDQEPRFRKLEAEAVAELLDRGPSVIALGGGALLNPATRSLVRERSLLVHLEVPWRDLRRDLPQLVASRPLLADRAPAQVRRLYLARLPTYREAELTVTIGRRGAEAAVDALLHALDRR
jgi:shikimate kinase